MSGLTSEGFERERLPEIKTSIEEALIAAFGELNLEPDSVISQIIGVFAQREALIWERLEEIYLAMYPASAEGFSLDNVGQLTGLTRLEATNTIVMAALWGDLSTTIEAGKKASVEDTGELFSLTSDVTISESEAAGAIIEVLTSAVTTFTITINGTPFSYNNAGGNPPETIATELKTLIDAGSEPVTVTRDGAVLTILSDDGETAFSITVSDPAVNLEITDRASFGYFEADNTGPLLALEGTLNQIETPVSGWESIINYIDGVLGRDLETDIEFRARRLESLSLAGAATVEAIRAHLLQDVEDVSAVFVEENRTDVASEVYITNDAAMVSGNVFAADVNGVPLAGAGLTFNTDNNTTMEAIAAIIAALDTVESAVASDVGGVGYYNTITIIADLGDSDSNVVTNAEITGGASQPLVAVTTGGLPPHSIRCVIYGGDDNDIAEAIWELKPAGIETYGSETVIITDSQGDSQAINFSRPAVVDVRLDVFITYNNEEDFPTDGLQAIEDAILERAANFTIAENIVPQKFYSAIYSIPGIATATITWEIGSGAGSPPYANDDEDIIVIDNDEIASFTADQITVRDS